MKKNQESQQPGQQPARATASSCGHHHDEHHHHHHIEDLKHRSEHLGHHHHHHLEARDYAKKTASAIWMAFLLNFIFAIVEFIGGLYTGSVSVQADSLHDFGDSLVILMGLVLHYLARRPQTKDFSFGFSRLEIFGAIFTGLVLISGSLFFFFASLHRLFIKPTEVMGHGMAALAVLGIVVNAIGYFKLHGAGHGKAHRMLELHLLEDLMGWVVVLVGGLFIWAFDIFWLDPLLSLLLSVFVMRSAWPHFIAAFRILLQANEGPFAQSAIWQELAELPFVGSLHHVHVWSPAGVSWVISMHVVLKESYNWSELPHFKKEIRTRLSRLGPMEVTIEFEAPFEECLDLNHNLPN